MTHATQYLSFLNDLQWLTGGLSLVLFMVYLWWLGKKIK